MARVGGVMTVPGETFESGAEAEAVVRPTFSDGTVEEAPFTILGPSR
jgi:hypothetical protein